MNVLDRYIVRHILGSVTLVMAVLLVLGGLVIFIEQQDDIGVGPYTAISALWFTLLNLPQQAYELLPIRGLIVALLGMGHLARGSDFFMIRPPRRSTLRLAGAPSLARLIPIPGERRWVEVLRP